MSDALPPERAAAPAPLRPRRSRRWHPVRLVVTDDLRRSRLTVFFRLLLAIPHYFWISLIGVVVALLVFVNWFILLFVARTPKGIHDFLAGYIRYTTQLEAYILLAANPYPAFWPLGEADYPVTLEIDPPAQQNRWKTFFRLFLAIPAFLVSGTLLAGGVRFGGYALGLAFMVAFLLWWVALFLGRSPRGLRDLVAFCVGYSAQLAAYLFLVTDRYPYSGPNRFVPPRDGEEPHPVRVGREQTTYGARDVLTFFRLPLSIPHIVWFVLWTIPAAVAAVLNWLCALVIGRAPRPFHRFLSRYVRYSTHLWAFLFLIGNPFPGFTGKPGTLSDRGRAAAVRAAEAPCHPLPRTARDPRSVRPRRAVGGAFHRRLPRLVPRAVSRPDARRAPQSGGVRPAVRRPGGRVFLRPDRALSGRRPPARSRIALATLGAHGAFV